MLLISASKYNDVYNLSTIPADFAISDHLGGFNASLTNPLLDYISEISQQDTVTTCYIFDDQVKKNYPNINFKCSQEQTTLLQTLRNYNMHPELNYKNFICSFNGADHAGRQLLVAALNKFGYFNREYCSKNFNQNGNRIDGHIANYVENADFYNKFFDCTDEFNQQIYSFGHVRYDHAKNIYNLENKLTQSFLHIVSETMATSYYPFVTEKSFYSIVTRGLFLSYAQPGWHAHIEKYYGFKLYTKLFDYRFDSITNPVERLVELMTMIGKFSKLTPHEWHDLYLLESDAVEFNYDHYFSKNYLKYLAQFD
jgi:hypothetical protein